MLKSLASRVGKAERVADPKNDPCPPHPRNQEKSSLLEVKTYKTGVT
jgi:hypothetical protein